MYSLNSAIINHNSDSDNIIIARSDDLKKSQSPSPSLLHQNPNNNTSNNNTSNNNTSNNNSKTPKMIVVEYIFIDGFNTVRSKTRIINGKLRNLSDNNNSDKTESDIIFNIDDWNVDGSSTGQSITKNSDIILIPRSVCGDPFNINTSEVQYYLCICEILNNDGTPHSTNNRYKLYNMINTIGEDIIKDNNPLFGIEQEYVILNNDNKTPYKWTTDIVNNRQGKFYCSVGSDRNFGREIALKHMNYCIQAGINICGVNSEVAPSQWEYQIGVCDPFMISDHLWLSRYILGRVAELYDACISYEPKPYGEFWNGSGAHTNFSTKLMRDDNGIEYIKSAIDKLSLKHKEHIKVYGENNNLRLTGIHETSNMHTFTYGDCDRGSSIRIPINVKLSKKGYLEDRRPASNMDPYLVCAKILETVLLQ